ncbi:MAG TPA: aspartate aminotransferase family protein [Ginsengibacter sp.]|nr:aspartate aminotransferase family protein [Ginsengibacter sp.]HRP18664.1 aspartate aminotransferase family protein [Ginsengibacter sp.]HRP44900.1 aspartate aminotransferase family protein [Ginsengibacter sp.]
MNLFDVYPVNDITIARAEGGYVWDDMGNQYLDFYGGHAVISIGHSHPHWKQRIKDQLDRVAFYSNSVKIPLQNELAEKLGRLSGKEDYQLFLCNSGAEANENAMKVASFYTGRKKVISFSKAFHGRTSLAVAVTDNPSIQAPVNDVENVIRLPFNDEDALREEMSRRGNEVAAIIIEGIQGVGGIRMADSSFLKLIRELCDQYGAVFIADEVQCGYGRSGKFFFTDHAEVEADIYSMAKGMGNGFPVAGIAIHPKIQAKHFMLGTTFGGSHLACAAALGVLEVIEKEQLIDHAAQTGEYLTDRLKEIPDLNNVRGKGLMVGFEVPPELKMLRKNLLLKHHIFTGEAKPDIIRLLPPLSVTTEQIDILIEAIKTEISFLKQNGVETLSISS